MSCQRSFCGAGGGVVATVDGARGGVAGRAASAAGGVTVGVEGVVALGGGGVPTALARAAFAASPAAVAAPAEAPGVVPVVSGGDTVVVASLDGGAADEGDVGADGVVLASVLVVADGLESLAAGVGAGGGSDFAVSTLATVEEVSAPNRARYPK